MQTSIRGLSPQAGGFRRRPNRPSSVGRGSRRSLTHRPHGRLPCVTASVYQAPAVPYHTPIRGSLSTPNIAALSSGEQYNTKQTLRPPQCPPLAGTFFSVFLIVFLIVFIFTSDIFILTSDIYTFTCETFSLTYGLFTLTYDVFTPSYAFFTPTSDGITPSYEFFTPS